MKLQKLISGAALALVMTACSSDEPAITPVPTTPSFEGDGYVAVSINLPTTTATSRAINDKFENGEDYEYYVEDAIMILFQGKKDGNEADATFAGAYNITVANNDVNDDPSNVTTEFNDIIKINNVTVDTETSLYALVMVNTKGIASISGNTFAIQGKNFTGTFGQLNAELTSKDFYTKEFGADKKPGYFFMASTPQVNVAGGLSVIEADGYKLTTLTLLDGKIYASKKEAEEGEDVAEIFVERAVAKVTLASKATPANTTIGTTALKLVDNSLVWKLDNVEETSFIVRNMGTYSDYITLATPRASETKDYYRFVGEKYFKESYKNGFRPYWCIDPNYDKDDETRGYFENNGDFVAPGDLYCHENTFDVAHQTYSQTTRVIVKARFALEGATDLYIVGTDKNTIYKTVGEAQTLAEKFIMRDAALQAAVQKTLEGKGVVVTNENLSTYVDINWAEKDDDAAILVDNISFKGDAEGTVFTDTKLVADANKLFPVYEYENGDSYYTIYVKHFGDDLTPWTAKNGTQTSVVYDSNNATKYLGRYGMVRNNWYDISIDKIANLGSPVVPDGNVTTSDDNKEEEQWIKFTINILSWAKRSQNVDL